MLAQFIASLLKLALASLIVGAGLSLVGITLPGLLALVGLTPESAAQAVVRTLDWAMPTAVLGGFVVVPMWLLIAFLRPPVRHD
jgi:hypothetical protein